MVNNIINSINAIILMPNPIFNEKVTVEHIDVTPKQAFTDFFREFIYMCSRVAIPIFISSFFKLNKEERLTVVFTNFLSKGLVTLAQGIRGTYDVLNLTNSISHGRGSMGSILDSDIFIIAIASIPMTILEGFIYSKTLNYNKPWKLAISTNILSLILFATIILQYIYGIIRYGM